ncbi:MAG: hypothetical protein H7A43_09815 [Verrucomicrobia bacterium]|nr:hypothetical protein [Verrucomicrobiota bacterium]
MDFETLAPILTVVASGVTILIALVFIAKLGALTKQVQRLSEQIPGTSMTAKELASELGGSIETSFKSYMPQPEKISGAIHDSVETALKTATSGVETVHKKLLDSQDALLDKLMSHEKDAVQGLESARKALESVATQLSAALNEGQQKFKASLDGSSQQLTSALAGVSTQLTAAMTDGEKKMNASFDGGAQKLAGALDTTSKTLAASLDAHAKSLQQSTQALQGQLDKILGLEKEIDKLLHLQEVTEGTMKSVSTSAEFKELIGSLKSHLAESDSLLRQAAKPKMIRLVEQDS